VSHENPGDGLRCDHCDCAAAETREGRLGFLAPNRGEQLCSICIWRAVEAEVHEATHDPATGLPWVRVTNERYRQQTMREIGIAQDIRRG
jgi:hypothetical protein